MHDLLRKQLDTSAAAAPFTIDSTTRKIAATRNVIATSKTFSGFVFTVTTSHDETNGIVEPASWKPLQAKAQEHRRLQALHR